MQDTKDTLEYICENVGKANYLITALLIGLSINILFSLMRMCVDIFLKNKDKGIHKSNILTTKSIDVQKDIYDDIYELSNYSANQSQDLYDKIVEIKEKIRKGRIYFDKKLHKIAFEILDYYLVVSTDYSKKDYKLEDEKLILYAEQYRS